MAKTESTHPLIACNIHFLQQGAELLQEVSDRQYVFDDSPYFENGVGKHMRHILDHYTSLFEGLNAGKESLDYDERIRGTAVEGSREAAIGLCREYIKEFRKLDDDEASLHRPLRIKSNEGTQPEEDPFSSSSLMRELQFLISHTVHHYALIAFILRTLEVPVPADFGVAPSTLRYQEQQAGGHTD